MEPSQDCSWLPSNNKKELAVSVRNAFKQYGMKHNRNIVLNGLNMTVEKGTM